MHIYSQSVLLIAANVGGNSADTIRNIVSFYNHSSITYKWDIKVKHKMIYKTVKMSIFLQIYHYLLCCFLISPVYVVIFFITKQRHAIYCKIYGLFYFLFSPRLYNKCKKIDISNIFNKAFQNHLLFTIWYFTFSLKKQTNLEFNTQHKRIIKKINIFLSLQESKFMRRDPKVTKIIFCVTSP